MGKITHRIMEKFRRWERPAQLAFATAIVLLVPAVMAAAAGPGELRGIATASVMGLVIAAQLVFMWANRGMVTNYTKAQRAYLAGDFIAARNLLESVVNQNKPRTQDLTLLGNTYRQLGQLTKSESVLRDALELHPDHPFPLYGLGRTLLVGGRYSEAIDLLRTAVDNHAPIIVLVDLLEARYRDGDHDLSREMLDDAEAAAALDEPHRQLLVAYLRYRLGEGESPASDLVQAGLPYWRAEAQRFAHTPYGDAVQADVQHLIQMM
jgi:predicted Zn-dependent protease